MPLCGFVEALKPSAVQRLPHAGDSGAVANCGPEAQSGPRSGTAQPTWPPSPREPLLNHIKHHCFSTTQRQSGILMNVHPAPPKNLFARHKQLPRFQQDGQPLETSQVAHPLLSAVEVRRWRGLLNRWRDNDRRSERVHSRSACRFRYRRPVTRYVSMRPVEMHLNLFQRQPLRLR